MPELRWRYGYEFALLTMAFVALGLLTWMGRQGWLSSQEHPGRAAVDEADRR